MSESNEEYGGEVLHELTDRDVSEMSKAALVAEWRESCEQTRLAGYDEYDEIMDRRVRLWQEMILRTNAEPPECPNCGGQDWHQNEGNPKWCGTCDLHLDDRHMDTIEAVDAYWDKVRAVPEEAEA